MCTALLVRSADARAHDADDRVGRLLDGGVGNALSIGAADHDDPKPLMNAVEAAETAVGGSPRRLFHLAVPPDAFGSVIRLLRDTGLCENSQVIIDKPFGTDLTSARVLNDTVHAVFDESQVFRIDHFLGKESVDNILALRFANRLFEPVWSRDHIQIDVPETIGIEGRGQFHEQTGVSPFGSE